MEIRLSQLPHEVVYILDSASEYGDITGAAHLALTLYGDPARIDEIIGASLQRRTFAQRRAMAVGLERYAGEIAAACSPERRHALMIYGAVGLVTAMDGTARWLAESNYEDSTKGGWQKPFRRRILLTRDGLPTPKVRRRLESPKSIRRLVLAAEETVHYRAIFNVMAGAAPLHEIDYGVFTAEQKAIEADLTRQAEVCRERQRAATELMLADLGGPSVIDSRSRDVRVRLKPEWRRRARHRRIKRAARTAEAILGRQAVSDFARGAPVIIPGRNVAFAVERAVRLDAIDSHGSVRVAVHDHRGSRLARLCVYQEETPPLDQLTAIALHVAAGEEEAILDTGNLFGIEPAAADHPFMMARVARKAAVRGDDRDIHRLRQVQYADRVFPLYRDTMRQYVFGRHWRTIGNVPLEVPGHTAEVGVF